ncbi:RES family NAD+ phosphorylase [Salaquimonas pukyongi]|uniref:RES family NAD+ phosphorylase n=1 Tax=Salaquimonas pukyongi TaxID=2712698 RepID=UPI00096BCA1A|nr:RES family NAD+ phosphorylase [Salaquimonas pukyongi]
MKVWRISAFADLSGRGGMIYAARWNHRGTPIVYTSDHVSTALLEMLVHADLALLPDFYQLLEIRIPDDVVIKEPQLRTGWQDDVMVTRQIWQDFVEKDEGMVLQVPCIIAPNAFNYLINPAALQESGIKIVSSNRHAIDRRFRV